MLAVRRVVMTHVGLSPVTCHRSCEGLIDIVSLSFSACCACSLCQLYCIRRGIYRLRWLDVSLDLRPRSVPVVD